jgi:ADP-ribosylglycohydrolase
MIAERFGYDLDAASAKGRRGVDATAAGTAPTALAIALDGADWEDAVRTAVGLGGDTDTVGCITGAVAEAIHGVPADVEEAARARLTEDLLATLDAFEALRRRSSRKA